MHNLLKKIIICIDLYDFLYEIVRQNIVMLNKRYLYLESNYTDNKTEIIQLLP